MWSRYKTYLTERATGLSPFRVYVEMSQQSAYWVVLVLVGGALGRLVPEPPIALLG